MLANGHSAAWRYPLIKVYIEAQIIRERNARNLADQAVMMSTVVAAALGGKEGHQNLETFLEKLRG